jgi:hypothetical protein
VVRTLSVLTHPRPNLPPATSSTDPAAGTAKATHTSNPHNIDETDDALRHECESDLLMEWRRVFRRMWGGNTVSMGAREVEWAVRCERGRLRTRKTAARATMGEKTESKGKHRKHQ